MSYRIATIMYADNLMNPGMADDNWRMCTMYEASHMGLEIEDAYESKRLVKRNSLYKPKAICTFYLNRQGNYFTVTSTESVTSRILLYINLEIENGYGDELVIEMPSMSSFASKQYYGGTVLEAYFVDVSPSEDSHFIYQI